MTRQERWLVAGITLLLLFGSAVRWHANRFGVEISLSTEGETTAVVIAVDAPPAVEEVLLDLNRCGAVELEALPGIGSVKARAIVDRRESHGPYRRVEDLVRVHGIGPKTVARLRRHVTVAVDSGEAGKRESHGL